MSGPLRKRYCLFITLSLLFFVSAVLSEAVAKCYFLECEPGDTPVPSPPPSAPAPRRDGAPSRPSAARPTGPYESCAEISGVNYCASSVLAPQYGFTYGPEKLADGRLDTAWVPGQGDQGDGVGEWLIVEFARREPVSSVQVLNGYHKNAGIFARNNRVRVLEVVTSEGRRKTVALDDDASPQTVYLDGNSECKWIQFIIRSVYRGSKYRDTAISELRIVH